LFAVAMQFLTRVPVPLGRFDPAWLHASARYFPVVGALVGATGAAVTLLAGALWPAMVAALLGMAATVWLTGGFHEDGLADTCDGLGGAVDRTRALAIMKDSRLGSYGALGLLLTLALKAASLSALLALSATWCAVALLSAHTVSRAVTVALLRALPYAGDEAHAKARPLARRVDNGSVGVALATALLVTGTAVALGRVADDPGATAGWAALPALVLPAIAVAVWGRRWLHRRLGGYTGDTLGAMQQWSELAIYLGLLAVLRWGA